MTDSDYKKEKRAYEKIKQLKRVQRFSALNRLLCYACMLPFLHATACLGQKQSVPLISKVGSAGFVASVTSICVLKKKEEKVVEALKNHFYKDR